MSNKPYKPQVENPNVEKEVLYEITRNFAFGNPVKQYSRGNKAMLDKDCADFAVKNKAAKVVK